MGRVLALIRCLVMRPLTTHPFQKEAPFIKGAGRERGGDVLVIMHGRSRMALDPRIPTTPGRSARRVTPDQEDIACCINREAKREVLGVSHEGRAVSYKKIDTVSKTDYRSTSQSQYNTDSDV